MTFDYGEKRPDGQYANHPTLPDEGTYKRPIRKVYRHITCGVTTMMGDSIAKTYATEPSYYGSTYCAHCHDYYPVGERGEFVWLDGTKVGT